MNRITTVLSILSLSAALTGCNTFNAVGDVGGNTVGTGVGFVSNGAYTAVNTVGSGLGTGLGILTSPITGTMYNRNQVLYRHGHAYELQNGRYIRVN